MTRRWRGERGVTLVEAAFVLPLFLLLVFGMVDLGSAAFQTSQATSAARDAARVGILGIRDASDAAAVQSAAREGLLGRDGAAVVVTCLRGLSGSTTVDCTAAQPGADRIRVEVAWDYRAPTFVGQVAGIGQIRGSATMVMGGRPSSVTVPSSSTTSTSSTTVAPGSSTSTTSSTTTTSTTAAPGSCVAVSVQSTPPAELGPGNSGHLRNDVTLAVTTNGAPTCVAPMTIRLEVTPGEFEEASLSYNAGSGRWETVIRKNQYKWSAGDHAVTILRSGVVIGPTFNLHL
jgi:Flp pilus assembly protein TadG